ncbi:DUF4229 domain-containing protein [Corynebacterium frankenforstense]|uniref:DUF4229 domain-containing protein n=1 Tax=Corynebacterium frankenforstense TaxID=1230998 RepID=UPI000AF976C8
MTDQDPTPTEPTDDARAVGAEESDEQIRSRARRALTRYGLARLGLFVALTVVIQVAAWLIGAPVPLVMSALLALLVAFPLSMLIFPRMRVEATQAVAARHERRRQRKEWIREELAGR